MCFRIATLFVLLSCLPLNSFGQQTQQPSKGLFGFLKKKSKKTKPQTKVAMPSAALPAASEADSSPLGDAAQPSPISFQSDLACEAYEMYLLKAKMKAENCKPIAAQRDTCQSLSTFAVNDSTRASIEWLKHWDYFSRWDNDRLKIYHTNLCDFTDTVVMDLFCEEAMEGWSVPIETNRITSGYGYRWRRWHHGVDFDLVTGDTILAPFGGIVRVCSYGRGFGYYIVMRHKSGIETVYAHLSKIQVVPGQLIEAGQPIGLGGNTGRSSGSHLHFEIRYQGHAIDPTAVFDFTQGQIKSHELVIMPQSYSRMLAFGVGCSPDSRHRHPASLYGSKWHRVRSGESLWTISRKYGVSISQICQLTGISRRATLRPGKRLRIR